MQTLIDRIKSGTTTESDARPVELMAQRLAAYEQALRLVAIQGNGDAAMLAAGTLADPLLAFRWEGLPCQS